METKPYETYDLYLASALKILGFRFINLKINEKGRGIFVFEDQNNRSQIVQDYFSGKLIGSLKAFANAWADLKNLLYEMEMERKDGKQNSR